MVVPYRNLYDILIQKTTMYFEQVTMLVASNGSKSCDICLSVFFPVYPRGNLEQGAQTNMEENNTNHHSPVLLRVSQGVDNPC